MGADTEIDHRVSLFVSGDETDDNLEALHKACHLAKSKTDWKAHAKIKRLIARQEGTRRERKPIPSRGFSKTLSRGFDGKVRKKSLQAPQRGE